MKTKNKLIDTRVKKSEDDTETVIRALKAQIVDLKDMLRNCALCNKPTNNTLCEEHEHDFQNSNHR